MTETEALMHWLQSQAKEKIKGGQHELVRENEHE